MQVILVILALVLSYIVGRCVLHVMGVVLFGSLSKIIIYPTVIGFFILMLGLGMLIWLFKTLFMFLGWLLGFIIACIPMLLVIGLVVMINKSIKNK